jgi:hypothetical protein
MYLCGETYMVGTRQASPLMEDLARICVQYWERFLHTILNFTETRTAAKVCSRAFAAVEGSIKVQKFPSFFQRLSDSQAEYLVSFS